MPSFSKKVKVANKTAQELYDRVSTDIEHFMSKASIGNFKVERDPSKKEVSVKSSMVSATLICMDGQMELNAQLSLLATPFKSKIDEGIERWLAKTFNGESKKS